MEVFSIQRVKCNTCGKTHALLLSNIVPYSQVPLTEQLSIISASEMKQDPSSFLDNNLLIDENNVKFIKRQYRFHWKQKLLSEGVSLLPAQQLVKQCFRFFSRQFMQIKRTPNILFLRPT